MVKDLGELEIYFKYGIENLKKIPKIIEIIIRDSKVSMKNYIKKLNRLKNFVKRFRSFCYGKKHLRNDSFVEYFLKF